MSKHTPINKGWAADYSDDNSISIRAGSFVDKGGPVVVATIERDFHDEASRTEAEANSAFIVRACNSHDALVKAGKKVLAGLNARIQAADKDAVPIFDGIAELHAALKLAGEP